MKLKSTLVTLALFVLFACDKRYSKSETKFFAYENVCSWNRIGQPDCLLPSDAISSSLLDFLNKTLPEGKDLRQTNPSLLSTNAIADIAITQPSDVYITFVQEKTSASSSFAFYTFPTNQPPKGPDDIKKIVYVFPNVKSTSPLQSGDKVRLGHFEAGTSIGFVLLQNAWNAALEKPNNGAIHLFSNDVLNPEQDFNLKKHAVLVNYTPENKILIGFEDALRTTANCDHDFNDVVFYATVAP